MRKLLILTHHQHAGTTVGGSKSKAEDLARSVAMSGRICWSVLPVRCGRVRNASMGFGREGGFLLRVRATGTGIMMMASSGSLFVWEQCEICIGIHELMDFPREPTDICQQW